MSQDRVTHLFIENFRTIKQLDLEFGPMTVLIGDNGVGKSTILEALEILRRVPSHTFLQDFSLLHGGLPALLRLGAQKLSLGISFRDSDDLALKYSFSLSGDNGYIQVLRERLELGPYPGHSEPLVLIDRDVLRARVYHSPDGDGPRLRQMANPPAELILSTITPAFSPHPALLRARDALSQLQIHIPFDVMPAWAARAEQRTTPLRASSQPLPAERLERLGKNLTNAYFELRNGPSARWEQTMSYIRLGLGDRVEEVRTKLDPSGSLFLAVKLRGHDSYLPSSYMSDGTLVYLAFVALALLPSSRTLLAMDEPELHLHPALLGRVMQLFDEIADEGCPVLLATHSDRVLDALRDPAGQVRICELNEGTNQLELRQLDRAKLDRWRENFQGIGELRSAGFLEMSIAPEEGAEREGPLS